jgi:hypothetical protein
MLPLSSPAHLGGSFVISKEFHWRDPFNEPSAKTIPIGTSVLVLPVAVERAAANVLAALSQRTHGAPLSLSN